MTPDIIGMLNTAQHLCSPMGKKSKMRISGNLDITVENESEPLRFLQPAAEEVEVVEIEEETPAS